MANSTRAPTRAKDPSNESADAFIASLEAATEAAQAAIGGIARKEARLG